MTNSYSFVVFGDGRAIAVQGDVAQRSDAQRLVAEAKKAFGRLDVLVNKAGVMGTEFKKQLIASTPLGRLGQPEDIARVAVFLASDDAGWLTGKIIFANGGNK